MQNPNAVAALASSQAAVAAEQLLSKYLDARVGSFWSQEITAAVVISVLYIGRNGLRSALAKVKGTAKGIWVGHSA